MSEFVGTIRQGEAPVYYFNFPCSSGSASFSGTPTVEVRDYYNGTVIRSGTIVTGMSGTAVQATPQAWFKFDTFIPGTIAPGWVSLICAGTVTGTDSISRNERSKIDLLVVEAWNG